MSRTGRLAVVAAAWVLPVTWVLAALLLSGPSDGTSLSTSVVPTGDARWSEPLRVARVFGVSALEAGDEVISIDGRSPEERVADGSIDAEVGQRVRYEVGRAGEVAGVGLIQQIDVTLVRYPVRDAVLAQPHVPFLAALLLAAGSAVFWRRPGALSSRAFLAAAALLPAIATSAPFGTSAIDLAGPRGTWPHLGGEVLATLGLVALLVCVASLVPTPRRALLLPAVAGVPLLGYASWLAARLGGTSAVERAQVLATVAVPALWATVPAALLLATRAHARAATRDDVLASRLVLLGLAAGLGAWVLLGQVPLLVTGQAPLSPYVLDAGSAAVALACLGVAAAHYRLGEIEPRVRRWLVQALVLVVVGALFVALVRAVDAAVDISVGSMLAGGLIALLLLPLAVVVQRLVRRLVYGDREFPDRVVSDLRRLDAVTAPEDALREMLDLLARRLHLSYAAVDVLGTGTSEPIAASTGQAYGTPLTVDLTVGGTTIGHLRVEVDAGHDPFGPGDRRLLEDVGTQVGALVQAVSANRELQVSRQRIVAAREEERRRLRRDLHDGLGPSLAALAMRLEAASDLVHDDPGRAADLVARLSDQAREDIGEVRRLVEGLRPPALDQLGLVSALRHRAAEHGSPGAPLRVPWVVEAADDLEPLPAAVEVAAYRIVVEAVNNAQKHSGADRCVVRLSRDASDLRIEVSDTGTGLAPDRRAGVGLSSMRERAEELGGEIEVGPGAEGGTVVRARLPLDDV
ncbi:signal transduction histidine kinase [Nocardioides cavernae]|uniref:Signal transduction histidine kinase n=1 Tax=Nocardioides cavernae TaxID=1921566 RepID=A0A7Y9KMV6_9ACTN|nr:sensor histidine kinase [Nocardioides cavernae]NYE35081.1 signal transduction histidine kinase [Nocardioides cavernae]